MSRFSHRPAALGAPFLAAPHLAAALLALLAWSLPAPASAAARKSAPPQTGPVILTQQPGTALDEVARRLNTEDLKGAEAHGERPLVLIGSAPLSSHRSETALFVQLQSASLCGSAGCSTSVWLKRGDGWDKVLDSVSGPIRVLPGLHGGIHDLMVGEHDRWVWSGSSYRDTLPAPPIGNLKRSVERHQAARKAAGDAAAKADSPK